MTDSQARVTAAEMTLRRDLESALAAAADARRLAADTEAARGRAAATTAFELASAAARSEAAENAAAAARAEVVAMKERVTRAEAEVAEQTAARKRAEAATEEVEGEMKEMLREVRTRLTSTTSTLPNITFSQCIMTPHTYHFAFVCLVLYFYCLCF